jgi:hypothetical protein
VKGRLKNIVRVYYFNSLKHITKTCYLWYAADLSQPEQPLHLSPALWDL